jgi:large conductance mechanosensitive channel
MLRGFKEFVAKGNVIDLAVGVIIGVAFGAVVDSLVKDVITPILGMIGGTPDFSSLKVGSVAIGNFINAIIAFLLKAAGLYFFIVLPYNRFMRKPAAAAAAPPSEIYLKEIRDLLARRPA